MNNQKVVITGASSGIGKEAARYFIRKKGHKVYAASRNLEKMEELKSSGVIPLSLDVTDEHSIDA